MINSGVFRGERVYLWRGRLVEKMTKYPPHNLSQGALITAMVRLLPPGWHVGADRPLALADGSMPEPDVMVVVGTFHDYTDRQATARDVAVVIEVSDSSLDFDAGEKLADYAAAGVPAYWIVDIPGRLLRVYTDPEGPSYHSRRDYRPDEEVPVTLDGAEVGRIAVRDIPP
jgi:Uma2 family endonuclease